MRGSAALIRKVLYCVVILGLIVAMVPYSRWLNQEKNRRDLGEATIGQVDAGSFMLKLALLGGARGIAANVLWTRALDLQKVQEWDKLKATVDLITKLQPHFLKIWTFQGWNLAYNVSVEWDAPEDKYEWIKQGINFLKTGVENNTKSPDLIWDTAWTYYHKVGFADEAVLLRRLFRDDPDRDFKTYPDARNDDVPTFRNDNFQLGFGWFTRSVAMVDKGAERQTTGIEVSAPDVEYVDAPEQRKGRPGDLAFRSMPAHAQTRYATSLEKMSILNVRPTFGEVASVEWSRALDEWVRFGQYPFPAFNDDKTMIYLDQSTDLALMARLDKEEHNRWYWTDRWANQMNYPYWKDRCDAERTPQGVEARRLFHEGAVAMENAQFNDAVKHYKAGLEIWDAVLKDHPLYSRDDLNLQDTGKILVKYARALEQIQKEVPKDTPFYDLLDGALKNPSRDPFDAMQIIPSAVRKRIVSASE